MEKEDKGICCGRSRLRAQGSVLPIQCSLHRMALPLGLDSLPHWLDFCQELDPSVVFCFNI